MEQRWSCCIDSCLDILVREANNDGSCQVTLLYFHVEISELGGKLPTKDYQANRKRPQTSTAELFGTVATSKPVTNTFGQSHFRRIRCSQSNQQPEDCSRKLPLRNDESAESVSILLYFFSIKLTRQCLNNRSVKFR